MRKRWKKNLGENPLNWGGLVELGNGFKKQLDHCLPHGKSYNIYLSTSFSYCFCIFMLLFICILALKVSQMR